VSETHVIDEARSPDDAEIWVMWCGASCFILDDGAGEDAGMPVPPMDFYAEEWADRANCPGCRARFGLPAIPSAELVTP